MLEATADGPEIHLKGGGFDNTGFGSTGWGVPTMGARRAARLAARIGQQRSRHHLRRKAQPEEPVCNIGTRARGREMEHRDRGLHGQGRQAPSRTRVAWTIHGPVIAWDIENGTAYSQQMGVHGRELDTWVAFAEMGRAKSLAEFKAKGVDRLGWNLGACYGGEDGTIAYFEAGALPKKAAERRSAAAHPRHRRI